MKYCERFCRMYEKCVINKFLKILVVNRNGNDIIWLDILNGDRVNEVIML